MLQLPSHPAHFLVYLHTHTACGSKSHLQSWPPWLPHPGGEHHFIQRNDEGMPQAGVVQDLPCYVRFVLPHLQGRMWEQQQLRGAGASAQREDAAAVCGSNAHAPCMQHSVTTAVIQARQAADELANMPSQCSGSARLSRSPGQSRLCRYTWRQGQASHQAGGTASGGTHPRAARQQLYRRQLAGCSLHQHHAPKSAHSERV